MTYWLFIDDERFPAGDDERWHIARCMDDVLSQILSYGAPVFISFDHDLGRSEPTGYDIAKALVAADLEGVGPLARFRFPEGFDFYVHSQNPIGAKNIHSLLRNYLKFVRE